MDVETVDKAVPDETGVRGWRDVALAVYSRSVKVTTPVPAGATTDMASFVSTYEPGPQTGSSSGQYVTKPPHAPPESAMPDPPTGKSSCACVLSMTDCCGKPVGACDPDGLGVGTADRVPDAVCELVPDALGVTDAVSLGVAVELGDCVRVALSVTLVVPLALDVAEELGVALVLGV